MVTSLSVTAVVISLAVPENVRTSVNKSKVSVPVSPAILKSVTNPVKPEPSPVNEPVNEPVASTPVRVKFDICSCSCP